VSILDALRVAVRAIAANGLRSFLTILGMVIGVGSVIVLVAVGQGANKGVQDQIRSLGTDLLFVQPGSGTATAGARGAQGGGLTLTLQDADAIASAGITQIKGVAPQLSVPTQAISGTTNEQVTAIATTPSYADVRGAELATGTFLSQDDLDKKSLNAVLGAEVASTLFPNGDALDSTFRVSVGGRLNLTFKVIGVLTERGGSGGGQQDSYIFVPLTTAATRLFQQRSTTGDTIVNQINIQMTSGANADEVKTLVSDLLMQRHNVATADFTLQSQEDLLGATGQVSRTLSILLGSIAGISLVVGGIGVMNIMLVSVTERTKEIGIRRAVGARRRDIVTQFVTEALALCIGGGMLGAAIGVGLAIGINGRDIAGQNMTTVIQTWSIALAFAVAAAIGAVSGSYPAIRASRLDPIEALRTE
jgi:putative ABC transport system permease protein